MQVHQFLFLSPPVSSPLVLTPSQPISTYSSSVDQSYSSVAHVFELIYVMKVKSFLKVAFKAINYHKYSVCIWKKQQQQHISNGQWRHSPDIILDFRNFCVHPRSLVFSLTPSSSHLLWRFLLCVVSFRMMYLLVWPHVLLRDCVLLTPFLPTDALRRENTPEQFSPAFQDRRCPAVHIMTSHQQLQ